MSRRGTPHSSGAPAPAVDSPCSRRALSTLGTLAFDVKGKLERLWWNCLPSTEVVCGQGTLKWVDVPRPDSNPAAVQKA